ncbi:hypothetical protein IFU23_05920 [Pantoea agglomerans]|uniref:Uncharacterized protein n=1 Tax=Enterobacter agglomerans TaxID=549 RepID=A0ACC5PWL8_ENTAG|nr:hypothetical protein [Pantoea agglomerans]MBD8129304.1 hypothetical protein [Pantoea agglomerans]MBD8152303.1 hypothetical protein [Pantoea agglomerans]MBD8157643.1 hypothetical protein [Pantoea agglomerans]MBD8231482.1 hypothetical protein [Pantoea agglomerans]MBD8241825.1 hypothetical protein [Pantoea agglomerans]
MEKLIELDDLVSLVNSKNNPFDNYSTVKDKTILAIAVALRAMEQRAEAAEALNKHLELAVRKAEVISEKLRLLAEAAETKLAELCDRQYLAGLQAGFRLGDAGDNEGLNKATANYRKQIIDSRSAPAADLAELVPGNDLKRVLSFAKFVIKCVRKNGEYAPLSSQEPDEIAAILHSIELANGSAN